MLLKPAINEMCYLKLALYGEAGSGKTFTASSIAIGLNQFIKSKKPISFADTETGSDFVLPRFNAAKIDLLVAKTRAFQDLLIIVDEAEKVSDVLITDSITHFWNELVDAYVQKNELKRLRLKDWIPLKKTWREFTDKFINSRLHIILCGRSADKWEEVEDEEDGAKELKKVGTKLRAETQLSYEPSLLIELEAIQLSPRIGTNYIHRAYVKKDRADILTGKFFDDPTFESILPHILSLNLGGEHKAIEPNRSSQDMFEKGNTGEQKMITREIVLEKITNEIKLLYPGQSEVDKTARIKLMNQVFGTNSWVEIEKRRNIEELTAGLEAIKGMNPEEQKPEQKSGKQKKEKKI
jgi:hypothetical protein